jgi:superfamily II DNA helicase RecQ
VGSVAIISIASASITHTSSPLFCNGERHVGSPLSSRQQWHWLAGLGIWLPPPLPLHADMADIIESLCAPASAPAAHLSTPEHLRALLVAHMQDAHANFDSMQLDKLHQLVRRDANVVLVLPAAGGKTLLLMLLARIKVLSVTIVILPFRALLDDLARRCQQHNVDFTTWTAFSSNNSNSNGSGLVFATAEQALLLAFSAWAARLHAVRKLHRLVLNDAHLMLTTPIVHQQLKQLRRLHAVSAPWGVISATLLPAALLKLVQ